MGPGCSLRAPLCPRLRGLTQVMGSSSPFADAVAAGQRRVPACSAPVLASCYCSGQAGFSVLNLAHVNQASKRSPRPPAFGRLHQGFAAHSSEALPHPLQRNSCLKSHTFGPSKNYTAVVTIYTLAYKGCSWKGVFLPALTAVSWCGGRSGRQLGDTGHAFPKANSLWLCCGSRSCSGP